MSEPAPTPTPESDSRRARGWRALELEPGVLAMAVVLAVVWLLLDFATDGVFLTARNLTTLAVQSSVVAIMATGMVLIIVARHIDLSVGSLLGFTGMLAAVMQVEWLDPDAAWGWPLALAAAIAAGALIGAAQGLWVAYGRVPAFVVTLAGLLIFRGGTYLLTEGRTVSPLHVDYERIGGGIGGSIGATWSWLLAAAAVGWHSFSTLRARRERVRHAIRARPVWAEGLRWAVGVAATIGFVAVMNAYSLPRTQTARGIPLPVLILLAVAAAMIVFSKRTRIGRHVFAIGGNAEASALAGIDVQRVTLAIFALMGALAGLAGVITSARLGAGAASMGTLAELNVIASAVIGGSSLAGGVGTVAGAVLGAVFMQSLENGMVLLGVSSALRQIAIGFVLILAVFLDGWTRRRRGR